MTKRLIVTVGLPHSGKSTWARQQGFPIVNPDSIRLAMHGQVFAEKAEPWVWAFAYAMAEALFLSGHDTVIVDATNTTDKRRKPWLERFQKPDKGFEVEFKIFETPPDECKRRAWTDKRNDLIPVIDRMLAQWDLPKPEGW